ncbi:MAG: carbon starvation CstA family protein, partial [Verrucomicrobiia bacterium]
VAAGSGALLVLAYLTYVKWMARRVYELDDRRVPPSQALADGRDYVPSPKWLVFGHHFTSIAGTGPIVGPAIAVTWGWGPALLWVVLGSIFIGAVHDLGSLVVSLRNRGRTIGEVAGRLMHPRLRRVFLLIFFLALTIVLAVFGVVVAGVFRMFPSAILPCLLQIPLAMGIGWGLRRGRWSLGPTSVFALVMMYGLVVFGDVGWLGEVNRWLAGLPIPIWVGILLLYSYAASVLPVWLLLQPRDYINALQLLSVLGLLVVGLMVAAFLGKGGGAEGLEMVAPMYRAEPMGAPPLFPFLFITVACGAISGFHCLVCSGTSSKQLGRESDAPMVGAGSMLAEGFLAVLVILACSAGIGLGLRGPDGVEVFGQAAWEMQYGDWQRAGGLAATVGAFVGGSANFLGALGIPWEMAVALMGVFVASFAGTTMDSSCRLQRYVIQELASDLGKALSGPWWRLERLAWNPHPAAFLAVMAAALLAAVPPSGEEWSWTNAGRGGLVLWPLFGATNQLLAGLALVVLLAFLKREGRPFAFMVGPLVLMLAVPGLAMAMQVGWGASGIRSWWAEGNWVLVGFGLVFLCLEVWVIGELIRWWQREGATSGGSGRT